MDAKTESSQADMAYPRLSYIGLSGMLLTFSPRLSESANRAALAFAAALKVESWAGVEECATTLTSVYIGFCPQVLSHAALKAKLTSLLDSADWFAARLPQKRRLWRIPAVFGGALAPQLDEAAALAGCTPQQAISQITGQTLRVMAIGFTPGQPYLGQLPQAWDIPRQTGLTPQVPKGALAVAIRQLVLFSAASPTGWRHIGQTAFSAFCPARENPFLLRPGDELRFEPVSPETFANMQNAPDGGASYEALS